MQICLHYVKQNDYKLFKVLRGISNDEPRIKLFTNREYQCRIAHFIICESGIVPHSGI